MPSLNILLIGENAAGIRALQSLRQSSHRVAGVMSTEDGNSTSLWQIATKFGHATWPARLVKDPDLARQIREHSVDMILNVHSLFLIHDEILQVPRFGSYNLHPGPLPRYAGLNPVCWAIYRGETKYGVTLHRIERQVDAGPIAYQAPLEISGDETGLSLTAKCVSAGMSLIQKLLETAAEDPSRIPSIAQDLSQREYFRSEAPENGNLSWRWPERRIFNLVRACDFAPFPSPWGNPRTSLQGRPVGILKAKLTMKPATAAPGTVGRAGESGAEVACADQWIVVQKIVSEERILPGGALLKSGDRLRDLPQTLEALRAT